LAYIHEGEGEVPSYSNTTAYCTLQKSGFSPVATFELASMNF